MFWVSERRRKNRILWKSIKKSLGETGWPSKGRRSERFRKIHQSKDESVHRSWRLTPIYYILKIFNSIYFDGHKFHYFLPISFSWSNQYSVTNRAFVSHHIFLTGIRRENNKLQQLHSYICYSNSLTINYLFNKKTKVKNMDPNGPPPISSMPPSHYPPMGAKPPAPTGMPPFNPEGNPPMPFNKGNMPQPPMGMMPPPPHFPQST